MRVKKYVLAMAKSFALVIAATTSLTVVTAVVAPVAFAAEKQKLSAKMKPLGVANELMAQKKWKEALEKINEVAAIPGKTAYEEALVNELKAYCYQGMRDLAGQGKIYEAMLAANQIPADQIPAKIEFLAKNNFQLKDYAKAIQYGERYLKDSAGNTEMMDLIARSYWLKGDFKTSSEYAQKLIKQAEQAKRVPEKNWYELLMSSQFKLDNKAGIISTLELLLIHYPSQEYWNNMFKYLANEASFSERETIEILRLKKAVGSLDAAEYMEIAELSLAMTDPGNAKAALEAGIAAGVLGQAKDKEREARLLNKAKADAAKDLAALDSMVKEANAKPTGDALAKVGTAYLGHGQFEKAATTIQSAIAKGGIPTIDESYIRLGAAYVGLGKKADAIKAFHLVSDKSKLARLSRLWVIHAQSKK